MLTFLGLYKLGQACTPAHTLVQACTSLYPSLHTCKSLYKLGHGSFFKGIARTQSPTIKNYALELPTFGVIVGVNQTVVQWKGLTLEEPPS